MRPPTERIGPLLDRLEHAYPEAKCSLDFETPLQLLVATILSAQCTDERVNKVTPTLFATYRTAEDYANANPDELAAIIRSTGFYNNKTKSLIGMGTVLVERYGGEIPRSLAELTRVPGVGRKTANVVLGNAFGIDEGIVVDTHVKRIANRLGLTRHDHPDRIERDLMTLVPRTRWTLFPHLMIHHGRAICVARTPKCEMCPVNDLCPFPGRHPGDGRRPARRTARKRR